MNKYIKKIINNAERKEFNLKWGILTVSIILGIIFITLTLVYENLKFLLVGVFLIGMLLPLYGFCYIYLSDRELEQFKKLYKDKDYI